MPLDVIQIAYSPGRAGVEITANSTPMFVLNSASATKQVDPNDPYGIAQTKNDNDDNVQLAVVPNGAAYLDLFHHFIIASSDFTDLPVVTTLKIRAFGWRANEKVQARKSEPNDYDADNYPPLSADALLLPVKAPSGNSTNHEGMWLPLYDKNGVHELEFDGTPEIIRDEAGELSSSSSSSSGTNANMFALDSDNHFVSLVGVKFVMVVVSRAAANTGTDLTGMVLGSFVW